MKKRLLKKFFVIGLIIVTFMPIVVYAFDVPDKNEEEFFSIDKNEASPGDTITMCINLEKVEYEDFEFTLTSNSNLSEIETDTEDDINASLENNQLKIVANKSQINLDKISLSYKIPEEIEIGATIELTGRIKKQEIESEENIIKETTVSITIVENEKQTEDTESAENNEQKGPENTFTNIEKEEPIVSNNSLNEYRNNQNVESKQMQTTKISANIETSRSNNQETIVYNGESNNYLASLTIDGYEINPIFSKTNHTYFVNVANDITKININAIAEDENAKVTIYGNENLKEGENKVLISITAENGEVRIYRVYVTREK